MNLAQYLAAKALRSAKLAVTQAALRRLCTRCLKTLATCYCSHVKPFTAPARVVVLIHPKESRKRVGTGRMTHLCIKNSDLIEGICFTEDPVVNALIADESNYCVVVYPGKDAMDVSCDAKARLGAQMPPGKRLVLFILDGSWFCAEKMLKISDNLRALPQIKFTPPHPSIYAIRRQPMAHCFSTIETAHFLLGALGGTGQDNLIEVFQFMINLQLRHGGGGRKRAERGERHVIEPPCTPSPSPSAAP